MVRRDRRKPLCLGSGGSRKGTFPHFSYRASSTVFAARPRPARWRARANRRLALDGEVLRLLFAAGRPQTLHVRGGNARDRRAHGIARRGRLGRRKRFGFGTPSLAEEALTQMLEVFHINVNDR